MRFALFSRADGVWQYHGMTPHEEVASEFKENIEEDHGAECSRVIDLDDVIRYSQEVNRS